MEIDGTCHCGRVTYHASVEPGTIGLCHCSDCQQLSGSPYRASIATRDLQISGDPKIYVKIAENGNARAQAFCPDCGSHLYAADAEAPKVYNLRLGSVVQRAELGDPRGQGWCRSALGWTQDLRAVPGVQKQG